MALEEDAIFPHLIYLRQTEYLVPPRVGVDRPLPVHEGMEPTELSDQLINGAEEEMGGIAEDDIGTEASHLLRGHRLDRCLGTHRQEGGGPDHSKAEV